MPSATVRITWDDEYNFSVHQLRSLLYGTERTHEALVSVDSFDEEMEGEPEPEPEPEGDGGASEQ